jgi:dihydrodipicolinate synthase/N-acetylneuraminate lyase
VDRAHHEAMMRMWDDRTVQLLDAVEHERSRYDALLEKYHALKLQGGGEAVVRAPLPAASPDEVAQAIALKAGTDPALRRHLEQYAKAQRLKRTADSDIVDSILNWLDDDEGVPA